MKKKFALAFPSNILYLWRHKQSIMITASRIQYLVIVVAVYDDRIEISNPGGLLPQVAENFGHKSLSRNPFIFKLFTRMQLVEKVGSGIPRMIGLMKDSGLKEPIFRKDGMFSISFPKITENATTEKNDEENVENYGENSIENGEDSNVENNIPQKSWEKTENGWEKTEKSWEKNQKSWEKTSSGNN